MLDFELRAAVERLLQARSFGDYVAARVAFNELTMYATEAAGQALMASLRVEERTPQTAPRQPHHITRATFTSSKGAHVEAEWRHYRSAG